MNRLPVSLAAVLLALPLGAVALSSDREQPIHITADRVELNEQTGISTYRGQVQVTQGSMVLEADRVVVYQREGELQRIEADGDPARLRQRPDEAAEDVRGAAAHIEYHADSASATLVGNAFLWRGRDEFRGERIDYETENNVVKAAGKDSSERVHAVIHPKQPQSDAQETP